jgi:hypothetical protein
MQPRNFILSPRQKLLMHKIRFVIHFYVCYMISTQTFHMFKLNGLLVINILVSKHTFCVCVCVCHFLVSYSKRCTFFEALFPMSLRSMATESHGKDGTIQTRKTQSTENYQRKRGSIFSLQTSVILSYHSGSDLTKQP